MEVIKDYWQEFNAITQPYHVIITTAFVVIAVVVVYDYARWRVKQWTLRRDNVVNAARRKRYLRSYIAWLITEVLEEAYFKNKITLQEKVEYYQMIGSRCHMPDLLPRMPKIEFPDPDELKERIRSRIKGTPVKSGRSKKIRAPLLKVDRPA